MVLSRGVCAVALSAALAIPSAPTLAAAAAPARTYVMKIALATFGDALHQYAKDYAAALERDSAGRIKVEIYPASKLGPIQQEAEGVQFGAIQCQIVPPEFLVGIDQRFEVLAAPGLVRSMAQGERLATDPAVRNLMLGLGANEGLQGVGLFMATPASIVSRRPIRHLADFKGKKIRIFASQFQSVAIQRLGAIPKSMTLGDVLPALQDNSIDAAVSALPVFTTMHYEKVAKYVSETDQSAIFGIVELSKRWYESLPADLQEILTKDAAVESGAIYPWAVKFNARARKAWRARGGELIDFSPAEQTKMQGILASVGEDVSRGNPALQAAYKIAADAAMRHH
jgi:TRAP-type C4-dicarboxylate transport system substrate-binding protein